VSIFTTGVVLNMITLHQLVLLTLYLKEARREKRNWCKLFLSWSQLKLLHLVTSSSCMIRKKHS